MFEIVITLPNVSAIVSVRLFLDLLNGHEYCYTGLDKSVDSSNIFVMVVMIFVKCFKVLARGQMPMGDCLWFVLKYIDLYRISIDFFLGI